MSRAIANQSNEDLANVALLNPVSEYRIDEIAQVRSEARLEQILAMNPAADPTINRSSPKRLGKAKWALIPVAATLILGAAISARPNPAFATWSATPQSIDVSDLVVLNELCRESWESADPEIGESVMAPYEFPAAPIIYEQRGDWAITAYESEPAALEGNPREMSCVFKRVTEKDQYAIDHGSAIGGWWYVGGFASASEGAEHIDDQGTDRTYVSLRSHGGTSIDGNHRVIYALGTVGQDVRDLVVHIPTGDVQATVMNGRFLAWWPAGSGWGSPERTRGFTVTTSDGTVLPTVDVDWSFNTAPAPIEER